MITYIKIYLKKNMIQEENPGDFIHNLHMNMKLMQQQLVGMMDQIVEYKNQIGYASE